MLTVLVMAATLGTLQDASPQDGAKRTVTAKDGDTITLRVRVYQDGKSYPTVVALPEDVANLIHGWDQKYLSLDKEGKLLSITLLAKAEGYLDVVTVQGTHLRLLISPVSQAHDSTVTVRIGAPAASEPEKTARRGGASGALDLIRAMRLGDVPPDATVRSGGNEVLLRTAEITVSVHYIYETGRFRGYVLGIANSSSREAFHVDVSRFTGEKLVLVGAKDVVIAPGKSSRLYVVDWK